MTKGILKFLVSIQIRLKVEIYTSHFNACAGVSWWQSMPWPSSWLTRKVVVHWMSVQVGKAKFHIVHDQLVFFLRNNQQTIVLQLLFICSYKLRSQVLHFLYSPLKTNIWNPKIMKVWKMNLLFVSVIFRWTIWVFQDLFGINSGYLQPVQPGR